MCLKFKPQAVAATAHQAAAINPHNSALPFDPYLGISTYDR